MIGKVAGTPSRAEIGNASGIPLNSSRELGLEP
jgi:hypothetical protein